MDITTIVIYLDYLLRKVIKLVNSLLSSKGYTTFANPLDPTTAAPETDTTTTEPAA